MHAASKLGLCSVHLQAVLSQTQSWTIAMEQLPAALPLDRLLSYSAPVGAICTARDGRATYPTEIYGPPVVPANVSQRLQQNLQVFGHGDFAAMWEVPRITLERCQKHVVL